MKITELAIENFRSIKKADIALGDFTAFVGPNGSGKSTVLTALRIFFRDTSSSPTDLLTLGEEDFHHKDTSRPIVITVTFSDLEDEAQTEFQHYFRGGKLVVTAIATWDAQLRAAPVKQYGERLVMKEFMEFFRAEKAGGTIVQLRQLYAPLREKYTALRDATTKSAMIEALKAFESAHPELCALERSSDEFYGFSKGTNKLQKFVQWVFIPAVKDASTEQLEAKKNALGILLERTVRSKLSFEEVLRRLRDETEQKYQEVLTGMERELVSLSKSLDARIKEWAHPEAGIRLRWHSEPARYVSVQEPLAQVLATEGAFDGDLSRFGHGLQRSFVFSLLQELSASQNVGSHLILACEEPELHQHPPQAKHLASVLESLSTTNSQILVCTHSPHFVSGHSFEEVRLVRKDRRTQETCVGQVLLKDLAQKISGARGEEPATPAALELRVEQTLQVNLNEMFFSTVLILVEGIEDEAYLKTYFRLVPGLWDQFRALGCHIVATGGKGKMIQPLAIAELLRIPTFVMFDLDGDKCARVDQRIQHEKDNLTLLRLVGVDSAVAFPSDSIAIERGRMWVTELGDVIRTDIGVERWQKIDEEIRKRQGINIGHLEKNALFIGSILTEAWTQGIRSKTLEDVCRGILTYAANTRVEEALAPASLVQR